MTETTLDSFFVLGIKARTTNAREMNGQGAIGPIWGRFVKDKLLDRIPNRVDGRIIAVYSDYENDKDGEYSYLLGAKVKVANDVPDGMASRQVIAGEYALFSANGRPPAEMVVGIWKEIWSLEMRKKLRRAYRTDFEVYDSGPDSAVEIYLGLASGSG
jgi:predicted transcriptional regulator YdeE